MDDRIRQVRRHYGVSGLNERIRRSLEEHGLRPESLTRDQLSAFDHFHAGGRDITLALARAADIRPGVEVLDIGCGIGGPARTLAAEFGARVTGLDATDEFIEAARMLTDLVGLTDRVQFTTGSATELPFPDRRFDVVWLQFVLANIPDKKCLIAEIRRVLKPGGRLALHEVMKGSDGHLAYPVFWAADASLNFLDTAEEFEQRLDSAGFTQLFYRNHSQPSLEWFRSAIAAARQSKTKPLGLGVIVPENAGEKSRNVIANLESGRIKIFLGAFGLPAAENPNVPPSS